jgi:hypothetical protein
MGTYVDLIEPRLTPPRPVTPGDAAAVLIEWTRDLEEELAARLELMSPDDLRWAPHPDANSTGVTIWHVTRFLDFRATRAFTGAPATADIWHTHGWREHTGYEPDGLGWQGLGLLTGYTPEQMRAVPALDAGALGRYLTQASDQLVAQIDQLRDDIHHVEANRLHVAGRRPLTPYQTIGSTLQGSFGHVGEIDTLVALRDRLAHSDAPSQPY